MARCAINLERGAGKSVARRWGMSGNPGMIRAPKGSFSGVRLAGLILDGV